MSDTCKLVQACRRVARVGELHLTPHRRKRHKDWSKSEEYLSKGRKQVKPHARIRVNTDCPSRNNGWRFLETVLGCSRKDWVWLIAEKNNHWFCPFSGVPLDGQLCHAGCLLAWGTTVGWKIPQVIAVCSFREVLCYMSPQFFLWPVWTAVGLTSFQLPLHSAIGRRVWKQKTCRSQRRQFCECVNQCTRSGCSAAWCHFGQNGGWPERPVGC